MTKQGEMSVFLQTLEMEDEQERAAFLNEACADDPSLRAEVESLLKAHDRSHRPLDERPKGLDLIRAALRSVEEWHVNADGDDSLTIAPGTLVGPYKIMEQIGEGGVGLVFVA